MNKLNVKHYEIIDLRDDQLTFRSIDQLVDCLGTLHFQYHVDIFIINRDMLLPTEFEYNESNTRLLLERCRNYNLKLVIIGDFTNNNIDDLIYACNNGKDLFLVENLEMGLMLVNEVLK